MMRFVPNNADDLRAALEHLSGDMPVEIGPGHDIATGTVDALRRVTDLPPHLSVSIPVKSQVHLVTVQKMT